MELITNIALISNGEYTQPYMFKLINSENKSSFIFERQNDESFPGEHALLFKNGGASVPSRIGNEWYIINCEGSEYDLKKSTVRMYFPQFSADTYIPGCTYALTFSTFIKGVEIELGSYIFKRNQALACVPERFSGMDEYYEYMDFEIVNPYDLHYGDDSIDIRASLGELTKSNNGAVLYVSLNIVDLSNNCYILKDGWTGGQNSIQIIDGGDIKLNASYNVERKSIELLINYNSSYDGLDDYIKYNYNIDNQISTTWEYVVMGGDDIYYQQSTVVESPLTNVVYLSSSDLFIDSNQWKEGLMIQGSVSFFKTPIDDDPFIILFSNKLPLTKELFSLMIQKPGTEGFPTKIELENIDMNNINITAINKIEQNVTVVTPTDSAKNHIIQPVFYQTRDLGRVIIHPQVTENISINLDAYKSGVKRFAVQVEGISFSEIGRTNKGVIFKIPGNMLPKEANEGVFYVLDQNQELITTGKYIYVS